MAVPLDEARFRALMAALSPFERAPVVAVAVSGGADSLCLAILAGRWAAGLGGRAQALTVDHGLRPEAGDEARQVGRWLEAFGIGHAILPWTEPKPTRGIQAAARDARYALMRRYCREAGILHLLVGHTRDDQAETVVMRLGRGSGADGLAAMAAIRETAEVRLLRPFLGLPREQPRAMLSTLGQPWIEDPSNRNAAYARVRVRRAIAAGGLDAAALARSADAFGRARVALEAGASKLLARAVSLNPAGFARVDRRALVDAPEEFSRRALARLVAAVGGRPHGPASEPLARALVRLATRDDVSATLGRCRLIAAGGEVLICREVRNLPRPVAARPGLSLHWDGRFDVRLAGPMGSETVLAPLGRAGWSEIVKERPALGAAAVPGPVRGTLPALFDTVGVAQVPHLGFIRDGGEMPAFACMSAAFRPPETISGVGFALLSGGDVLSQ